jgi:MATE family multidrug resistance protein
VLLWLGLGLPANLLFVTNNFFLEAIKRPVPGMVAMISMNILNIGLNWLLVYGHYGFPEMGAAGAAAATSFARFGLAIMLFVYIWNMPDYIEYGIRMRQRTRWCDWQKQRQLGYATGASGALESTAFAFMTLFAGWLGTYALSTYSLAINLMSLIFMVALGIATATAVRVSIAHGRMDHRDLALAGWTGLGVNTVLMSLIGLMLLAIPAGLASLYTTDVSLVAMVAPVIAFTAYIMIADGGQVVILSALRGRGDAWLPALAHAISYIVVMVPVSWWLAFKLDHGVMGLMEGILIASVFSIILLCLRFQYLATTDRHRISPGAERMHD